VQSLDVAILSLAVAMVLISLFPDPRLAAAFVSAALGVLAKAVWFAFSLSLGVLASSSVLLAVQPAIEHAVERRNVMSKIVAIAATSGAALLAYYLYWTLRALSASTLYDVGFFVDITLALPWKKEGE